MKNNLMRKIVSSLLIVVSILAIVVNPVAAEDDVAGLYINNTEMPLRENLNITFANNVKKFYILVNTYRDDSVIEGDGYVDFVGDEMDHVIKIDGKERVFIHVTREPAELNTKELIRKGIIGISIFAIILLIISIYRDIKKDQ